MKSIRLLALLAAALTAMSASALTITYVPPVHGGNINSVADLNALGLGAGDQMWYNTDGGGTHQSDFSNLGVTGTDTLGFTIHLDYGGGTPLPNINYAALKAANSFILFSVSGWNGENIDLLQDKIANGNDKYQGISHAILFGVPGVTEESPVPPTGGQVPEGGATAALLGIGSLAVAALRKILR
jgi:hypothetical protein